MKKIFYGCLCFVAILAIWIVIGSIDSAGYDDLGLLDDYVKIPEEQNGYREISYIHNENFELSQDDETKRKIKNHLYNKEWDDDFVQQVLNEHKQHINNALSATKYKFFKFPEPKNAGDLIIRSSELYISRFIILKSMSAAKAKHFSEAILLAKSAIIFSQQVKNNELISYVLGLIMQYESLSWIHHLSVDYELSDMQYTDIAAIFHQLKSYKKDSFSMVFSMEYIFFVNSIEASMERSFVQRWDDYLALRDYDGKISFGRNAFNFFQVLFPRYYVHKNRMLSQVAQQYTRLSKKSRNYCNNLHFEDVSAAKKIYSSWIYIIKPNSAFEFSVEPDFYNSIFKGIYSKRCFTHAYAEGVKVIIALKRFQIKTGGLPDSLVELIPNYLKTLPVDPFNGDTLKYDKEKMWLYSVGDNFEDNGGSKESFYSENCKREPLCSNNPTFSVVTNAVMP